ncbi:MAG: DUF5104 domain-containing protein [Oscillospiraceae bacterium]|nr:DUF5104 domain-containing protein [Oscillospiraceae bacterium]
MFCERLRNKKDVDDELQKVIDIFQGEIISYTAKGAEGGASWSPEGNQVSAWASCSDILMSTGKIYHLYLSIYKENDFHPDMLGIYSLEVSEKDEISGVWIELIRIEV